MGNLDPAGGFYFENSRCSGVEHVLSMFRDVRERDVLARTPLVLRRTRHSRSIRLPLTGSVRETSMLTGWRASRRRSDVLARYMPSHGIHVRFPVHCRFELVEQNR